MQHAHFIGSGLGNARQTCLMLTHCTGNLESWQKEKRDPNDADDAGQGGQHHRHHWGSVSPLLLAQLHEDYKKMRGASFLHGGLYLMVPMTLRGKGHSKRNFGGANGVFGPHLDLC